MLLSLLILLITLFLGYSLSMIFSLTIGAAASSALLLLIWILEKPLGIRLRLGKPPMALWAIPLLWLVYGGYIAYPLLVKKQNNMAKTQVTPLRQELEANARVDKTQLVIEKQRLTYYLTIRYRKGLKPKIPKITNHPTFHGPFVMPADKLPKITTKTLKNGIIQKDWKLVLVPVATGPLDTPRFVITYLKNKKKHRIIIPKIAIEVVEQKQQAQEVLADLQPAKGPILPEKGKAQLPLPLITGVSVGLFLLFLILIAIVRYQNRPIPPIPPHVWVEAELSSLDRKDLLEKGGYKEHYFLLSEIVRGYLEKRYKFPALENTTEEILLWCKKNPDFAKDLTRDIRRLLQWMDGVKFAGIIPEEEKNEEIRQRLKVVLERTRPTQEETEEQS